jgi:hypothetical protein
VDLLGLGQGQVLGGLQDRPGDGVLAIPLQGGGKAQGLFPGEAQGEDLDQGGPSQGQGSRLVQGDGVRPGQGLEGRSFAEDEAHLGRPARGHGDGRGRGQAHGAGAGDEEDGEGGHEGVGKPGAQEKPEEEGEEGDAQDHGHEDGGDPVR